MDIGYWMGERVLFFLWRIFAIWLFEPWRFEVNAFVVWMYEERWTLLCCCSDYRCSKRPLIGVDVSGSTVVVCCRDSCDLYLPPIHVLTFCFHKISGVVPVFVFILFWCLITDCNRIIATQSALFWWCNWFIPGPNQPVDCCHDLVFSCLYFPTT